MTKRRWLWALLAAVVLAAIGYAAARTVADPDVVDLSEVERTEGPRVVDRVRALFPQTEGWFRIVADAQFRPGPGGRLVPVLETLTHPRVRWEDGSGHSVFSQLAHSFRDATRIGSGEDPDVWVDAIPLAGNDVRARIEDGLVVYEGAYDDTDVLYKSTPTHVDEYLLLGSAAAPTTWRYRIRKGPGIARLRQAGNAVEAVDARGVPWIRANRPLAVDRDGNRVEGTIRIEGDVLVARIDLSELSYPVLVDPDWKSTGDMAYGRFYHQTNVLPDGRVLATGGCSASVCSGDLTVPACRAVVAAAEALDLGSRTFSRVDDGSIGRFFHLAESLPDGSVLVAGGCATSDCSGVTDEAEILDAETYSFRPVAHLPRAVAGMVSVRLADGRILIAGGCTRTACETASAIFDPATESYAATAPMRVARGRASATLLDDGRVAVIGGCTTIDCAGVHASAEIYDPSRDTWSRTDDMSARRAGHWAASLGDGRVIVGGGCDRQDCATVHATTEVLDAARRSFGPGPPMHRPRVGAAALRLPDGNVLVNQGCASRSDCDLTNEIFDVAGERFAMVEQAVTVRAFHSLALHPSERLAIANGGCQPRTCSWWVETWDVSDLRPLPDGGVLLPDGGIAPGRDAGPGRRDAGRRDASGPRADAVPGGGGGCACRAGEAAHAAPPGAPLVLVLLGLFLVRRRR